jgi:maltokinase
VAERLVDASYPADEGLLTELRAAWPSLAAALASDVGAPGYAVHPGPAPPIAALRPLDRFAIALSPNRAGEGQYDVHRLTRADGAWRPMRPGDGLSALVAGAPSASERGIGVDQTHASVVVGERVMVKWFRRVGPGPSRAALLLAHLTEIGFHGIPAPLGTVTWRSPEGVELTLAQGDAFLPEAHDGWEWVVEQAVSAPKAGASVGRQLGELVAGVHEALARPSSVIPDPVTDASPAEAVAWRTRASSTLGEAIDRTDGDDGTELRAWEPAIRDIIEALPTDRPIPIRPVHGDLHVGQVLAWRGGLAVIDFDGNPTLDETGNAIRQPRERDLAQMATSLDHVGRVVAHHDPRRAEQVAVWIAEARDAFLSAGAAVDLALLDAFEVEQECRELVYAARFLPRWRYAPMAALRARFGVSLAEPSG